MGKERLSFEYKDSSMISPDSMRDTFTGLIPEIERISAAVNAGGYESPYASVNVSDDQEHQTAVKQIIAQKRGLKPTMLVVIGIGGSNLGTIAVHEALQGTYFNESNSGIKIYFADTVDSDMLVVQLALVENELKNGNTVIINVVTKSGSTTETIANFEIFLALLKKYYPDDYQQYVVIITDESSKLAAYGVANSMSVITVPRNVGGRYSLFTGVGLFPLGLCGVDIDDLIRGARDIRKQCLSRDVSENPAAASAVIKSMHNLSGVAISDLFIFSKDLSSIGLWYRQLMGESIGKTNRSGKEVGMTPTVSVGSTDLHSVGQLYLGGPRDKLMTFLTVKKNRTNISVPSVSEFEQFVAKIQGRPVSSIMNAIVRGVQNAYKKNKRPYMALVLPEKTAYWVGALMQMYMIEMMYIGALLEVNPFDQPHVELYKKETREILESEEL